MTLKEVKNANDIFIDVAFYDPDLNFIVKMEKCKVEKFNSTYCKIAGVKRTWKLIHEKYNKDTILKLKVSI